MIVWLNGGNGSAFHPRNSAQRRICLVSAPTLTTCLLVTKYRNRQQTCSGRLNRRYARNRRTQSLLPAPESGHCESSWHHLLSDVLSLQSRRQSHLIPDDLAQFPSPPRKNAKRVRTCPAVPSAKCWNAYVKLQSRNYLHGPGEVGWRMCSCNCSGSIQQLNWLVSAAVTFQRRNLWKVTFSQFYFILFIYFLAYCLSLIILHFKTMLVFAIWCHISGF